MTGESKGPAIVERDALVAYLDELLESADQRDSCPNGLQVEGKAEIRKVLAGVSACRELFEVAGQWGADAVLVHHGILWPNTPSTISGPYRNRLAVLMQFDLNLIAYHLPLDRHPVLGNNAQAALALGLRNTEPFGILDGRPLGIRGELQRQVGIAELEAKCREVFGQEPLVLREGGGTVKNVALLSGAGGDWLEEAARSGADVLITGEAQEWSMNLAREYGIHFVAAGHYATETLGIKALADHIAATFPVQVAFHDIPNPV